MFDVAFWRKQKRFWRKRKRRQGPSLEVVDVASGVAGAPSRLLAFDLGAALELIRGAPAPGARADAAGHHAFAVDVRDDIAVAAQPHFGRA